MPGGLAAPLMYLGGLVLVAAGVALEFAHRVSPELASIDAKLVARGVEHGALALTGVVVFCLGLTLRSLRKASRWQNPGPVESATSSDAQLVADQLGTDISHMLSTLMQLSEVMTNVRDHVQRQGEQQSTSDTHNAVFKLATSVDQLNARVDQRLSGFDLEFRKQLAMLLSQIDKTVKAVPAQLAQMQAQAQQQAQAQAQQQAQARAQQEAQARAQQQAQARAQQEAQARAQQQAQPQSAPEALTLGLGDSGNLYDEEPSFGNQPAEALSEEEAARQILGEVEETSQTFFESLENGEEPDTDGPPPVLPNETPAEENSFLGDSIRFDD